MKLSRTIWLSLGIGLVIIVFSVLFLNYDSKAGERDSIVLNIDNADKSLLLLISQMQSLQAEKAQLEGRLPVANTSLEEAKAAQYLPVHSIEYGEALFKIAGLSKTQIVSLSASSPADQVVSGINYTVIDIELDVAGDLQSITGFLHELAVNPDLAGISITSYTAGGISPDLQVHISLTGYKYKG